ncbi:keratin [Striga asiatica]|uniref:Keratin n=1 Tax=Striga asiatica TaxID=4170 RepID=A0A5A7Q721_STRAF|nr:keratin [Striga asiatica]
MNGNPPDPLAPITDGTATFDPGDTHQQDTEFPVLNRDEILASKRHKTLKRPATALQAPRWTFRDMLNKQRNHVDVQYDDAGKDTVMDDDVSVDLDCPLPEVKIAQRFFDQIIKSGRMR